MGIILKRSRQMFNELIGTNSFDEIFKTVSGITTSMALNLSNSLQREGRGSMNSGRFSAAY